jgi:hypothetical protein
MYLSTDTIKRTIFLQESGACSTLLNYSPLISTLNNCRSFSDTVRE